MKKTMLFVSCFLGLLVFVGCNPTTSTSTTTTSTSTSTTSTTTTAATPLTVPTGLALSQGVLSWNAVPGATGYVVKINAVTMETANTQVTVPESILGQFIASVQAKNATESTAFSSELSFFASRQLPVPANLRQDGNVIRWDEVAYATGYVISINGVEYLASTPSFEWTAASPSTVMVLATGNLEGTYVSSLYSEPLIVKAVLPAPTNVALSGGILTWTTVEHALGYELMIDDGATRFTAIASLDVRYEFVGQVGIWIRTLSASVDYMDSEQVSLMIVFPVLTMPTPTNLVVLNGILTFDPVAFSSGYEIISNDIVIATITTTSYAIPEAILNAPGSTITVRALSLLHSPSLSATPVACQVGGISTEAELRAMGVSGSYVLMQDIVLTQPWTPKDFSGTFNGNQHTISGIVITNTGGNVGFFATLDQATIRNLTLQGQINGDNSTLSSNVGGLAGHAFGSLIDHVTVEMTLSATSNNGVGNLGGLIGLLQQTTILSSRFEGAIAATHYVAGGLIGKANEPDAPNQINQSIAVGSIIVVGGEQSFTGGFIGQMTDNHLTITESIAQMATTGPNYVGGFVGYMGNGIIQDSLARGTVIATATNLVHLGGFVGRMEGYNNQVIRSVANVQVTGPASGTNLSIGGFVGRTPGGTYASLYTTCLYNNTLSPIDRIGNPSSGRGDGITGRSQSQLQLSNAGFLTSVWTFDSNGPKLNWES
jgi:hypothetical protein